MEYKYALLGLKYALPTRESVAKAKANVSGILSTAEAVASVVKGLSADIAAVQPTETDISDSLGKAVAFARGVADMWGRVPARLASASKGGTIIAGGEESRKLSFLRNMRNAITVVNLGFGFARDVEKALRDLDKRSAKSFAGPLGVLTRSIRAMERVSRTAESAIDEAQKD